MTDRDILFVVKNNFYIGAYNNAINEASDLEGLSDAEQTEKDIFVYRSYIALGSHDVSEADVQQSAIAAPQSAVLCNSLPLQQDCSAMTAQCMCVD